MVDCLFFNYIKSLLRAEKLKFNVEFASFLDKCGKGEANINSTKFQNLTVRINLKNIVINNNPNLEPLIQASHHYLLYFHTSSYTHKHSK